MVSTSSTRLTFRKLQNVDVSEKYVSWLNDPEVNRFLETRFFPQTLESCRQFVADMDRDPLSHLFGIFEKESHQHIGNIKLGFINKNHMSGQLSLLIGEKSCWRKGYATESIKTITQWGFNELGLHRVEAGCYDANLASLRAFLNAGYTVEGYFRKSVLLNGVRMGSFWLGILREEMAT
jgi:RimJ/RimL family protein N-acetyltransferase